MEGAIFPAKSNAYGQAVSSWLDDTAGNNHRNGDKCDLGGDGEGFPLPAPEMRQKSTPGALHRPPAIMVSVLSHQLSTAMPREPDQPVPAESAAEEDDEVSVGRLLAARFARQPAAETAQPALRRSMLGFKPSLAAGALFVAAVCASALYLSTFGEVTPAASAYTVVAVDQPSGAALAAPEAEAQEDGELSPVQVPTADDRWAAALETFKTLAASRAAPNNKAQ